MRLRKNKFKYKFPPMGHFVQAYIKGKDYDVAISHMSMSIMISCDHSVTGIPSMCSIDQITNLIWFWPTPDKAMVIRVRYLPAMVEI